MQYFHDPSWHPIGDGRCSDNNCPCPETPIPRGEGYLYVGPEVVELRLQHPSHESAVGELAARMRSMQVGMGFPVATSFGRVGPVLVCEEGARLRGLNLRIAGADAKHWWRTGEVPLRATPLAPAAWLRPMAARGTARGPSSAADDRHHVEAKKGGGVLLLLAAIGFLLVMALVVVAIGEQIGWWSF